MPKTNSGGKLNKSQAIRDTIAANPKIKTREVVAQLATKGIKVTPTLVYFIKSHEKKAKRKQNREQVTESMRRAGATSPADMVSRVRQLARDAGGWNNLKQFVDVLSQ